MTENQDNTFYDSVDKFKAEKVEIAETDTKIAEKVPVSCNELFEGFCKWTSLKVDYVLKNLDEEFKGIAGNKHP